MAAHEFATLTTDDLVTGEAVALDLPPASLGSRIGSGLIDVAVTFALLVVLVMGLAIAAAHTDEALLQVAMLAAVIVAFLAFPTALETLTGGRSLGKMAFGLRAVRDDAGPISFHHAFVRALVGVVEIYVFFGSPAFFSALLSPRGKRLGDYAAGTYVVRERVRLRLAAPPPMPPQLASWARHADLAALPTGLALAVRQFLGRYPSLDPASRVAVGARLGVAVREHVAPPPPPQ
ncbi:RDD family protein, partial [Nocardioides aquiterrae]|uniref:RDD family protein n=1 Tax=Nocardioides aquiterrae TaxID=203799 RepID=UPI0031E05E8B